MTLLPHDSKITFIKKRYWYNKYHHDMGYYYSYDMFVDGKPLMYRGKYLDGRSYEHQMSASYEDKKHILIAMALPEEVRNNSFIFTIKNFKYNGFGVEHIKGIAKYMAKFLKWSGDPGVAIMECSDHKTRHIPTCAIIGYQIIIVDNTYNDGTIFGMPSKS